MDRTFQPFSPHRLQPEITSSPNPQLAPSLTKGSMMTDTRPPTGRSFLSPLPHQVNNLIEQEGSDMFTSKMFMKQTDEQLMTMKRKIQALERQDQKLHKTLQDQRTTNKQLHKIQEAHLKSKEQDKKRIAQQAKQDAKDFKKIKKIKDESQKRCSKIQGDIFKARQIQARQMKSEQEARMAETKKELEEDHAKILARKEFMIGRSVSTHSTGWFKQSLQIGQSLEEQKNKDNILKRADYIQRISCNHKKAARNIEKMQDLQYREAEMIENLKWRKEQLVNSFKIKTNALKTRHRFNQTMSIEPTAILREFDLDIIEKTRDCQKYYQSIDFSQVLRERQASATSRSQIRTSKIEQVEDIEPLKAEIEVQINDDFTQVNSPVLIQEDHASLPLGLPQMQQTQGSTNCNPMSLNQESTFVPESATAESYSDQYSYEESALVSDQKEGRVQSQPVQDFRMQSSPTQTPHESIIETTQAEMLPSIEEELSKPSSPSPEQNYKHKYREVKGSHATLMTETLPQRELNDVQVKESQATLMTEAKPQRQVNDVLPSTPEQTASYTDDLCEMQSDQMDRQSCLESITQPTQYNKRTYKKIKEEDEDLCSAEGSIEEGAVLQYQESVLSTDQITAQRKNYSKNLKEDINERQILISNSHAGNQFYMPQSMPQKLATQGIISKETPAIKRESLDGFIDRASDLKVGTMQSAPDYTRGSIPGSSGLNSCPRVGTQNPEPRYLDHQSIPENFPTSQPVPENAADDLSDYGSDFNE